jgi:SAM-dependent MidA family methyltransferase
VPIAARAWLERIGGVVAHGDVVLVDYAAPIAELLERGPEGWLRTYRRHDRGGHPLEDPGTQDITYDLPLEYLAFLARRLGFELVLETDQASWLRSLGIDELVEAGEVTWRERAHLGDLVALAGRSRATEAAALTDPAGLGAHRVMVLRRV